MDFVTFEIAKKLKEKGYPQVKENTLAMYNEVGEWYSLARNLDDWEYSFEDFDDRDCVCPTISQVLKWLRKEKDIYITIFIDDDSDTPVTYEIYKNTECVCTHQGEYFTLKDWNKCELRAIEYTLDNLI